MPKPGQRSDNATWLLRANEVTISAERFTVARGVFAVLSDIYLLVIPIQMIFQLNLPFQRKIGISTIFMIGVL